MIKESILQGYIRVLNMYALNNRIPKYIRQKLVVLIGIIQSSAVKTSIATNEAENR